MHIPLVYNKEEYMEDSPATKEKQKRYKVGNKKLCYF